MAARAAGRDTEVTTG